MEEKEQQAFDKWWFKNNALLTKIYLQEPDPKIAVMDIAEKTWEGAVNAKKDNNIK